MLLHGDDPDRALHGRNGEREKVCDEEDEQETEGVDTDAVKCLGAVRLEVVDEGLDSGGEEVGGGGRWWWWWLGHEKCRVARWQKHDALWITCKVPHRPPAGKMGKPPLGDESQAPSFMITISDETP